MTVVRGKLTPIKGRILVSDMKFGEEITRLGLVLLSDDGKVQGIKPRWGKVWALGEGVTEVSIGQWVLVEHGRWTRKFEIEQEDGEILSFHGVDPSAIMMVSDEHPSDVMRGS
jgi:co-chaperonin GroES (HSP10)